MDFYGKVISSSGPSSGQAPFRSFVTDSILASIKTEDKEKKTEQKELDLNQRQLFPEEDESKKKVIIWESIS